MKQINKQEKRGGERKGGEGEMRGRKDRGEGCMSFM